MEDVLRYAPILLEASTVPATLASPLVLMQDRVGVRYSLSKAIILLSSYRDSLVNISFILTPNHRPDGNFSCLLSWYISSLLAQKWNLLNISLIGCFQHKCFLMCYDCNSASFEFIPLARSSVHANKNRSILLNTYVTYTINNAYWCNLQNYYTILYILINSDELPLWLICFRYKWMPN